MDYHHYFMDEVPNALSKLKTDTTPQWGTMSAPLMLDHLRVGVKMSLENLHGEITAPEEKLPSYKKFLMSDRPFAQGLAQPGFFIENTGATDENIEDLKLQLMKDLLAMQTFFIKNPDHVAIHPSFGKLGVDEWLHLHRKHFLHHFTQFGLVQHTL